MSADWIGVTLHFFTLQLSVSLAQFLILWCGSSLLVVLLVWGNKITLWGIKKHIFLAEKHPNFKVLSLKPVPVLAAVSSCFQAATIPRYDMMQTHFNESLQKLKMPVFYVDFCKYKFTCVHLPPCLHDKETVRIIRSHHPLVIQVNR